MSFLPLNSPLILKTESATIFIRSLKALVAKWQTRKLEVLVGNTVEVRVLSSAFSNAATFPPYPMITHVVVFWTDKPHASNRDALLAGAHKLLADIPGALNFRAGSPVSSPRAVVDDSFAVAISMDFATQTDAELYQNHPLHQEFIETCVKPYSKRLVVYDFGT